VVIFLIYLSGCVLLGFLLWRHRKLFIRLDHGGRQCWGVRKSDGIPEHKWKEILELAHERIQEWGDKESPKVWFHLKSCKTLFTCPRTTFYSETKGLLHFKITLESREYSTCEHVQKCLLHYVIFGANFTYLQADHLFTLRTRTFDASLFDWVFPWPSTLHSRKPPVIQIPELSLRHHSRNVVPRSCRVLRSFHHQSFPNLQWSPKFLSSWNIKRTCELIPIRRSLRPKEAG
jgi:hypothetical protein